MATISAFITAYHLISALGEGLPVHKTKFRHKKTGIKTTQLPHTVFPQIPAGKIPEEVIATLNTISTPVPLTRMETLLVKVIRETLLQVGIEKNIPTQTLVVISTTKGNIDLIDPRHPDHHKFARERLALPALATAIQKALCLHHPPLVISNACISGTQAIHFAASVLKRGVYKQAIVAGADLLSSFTVTGFESLRALSPDPCKPYDKNRKGVNLGEGAGAIWLQTKPPNDPWAIEVSSGAISNDANHISGPSRTGKGLQLAIRNTLEAVEFTPDLINTHGTATLYNDEMEAKALKELQFSHIPINSFKGFWGHTLGAAGILESIMAIEGLRENEWWPTLGFEETGTSLPLPIQVEWQKKPMHSVLKTASGFGGGNAAVLFQKTSR